MNIKQFIFFLSIFISVVGCDRRSAQSDQIRYKKNIDLSWEFQIFKDSLEEKKSLNKTWNEINLPHDWSIEGPFDINNTSGKPGAYLPGGIGWYQKKIEIPKNIRNHRVIIEFDGIYKDADIWLNDHFLGHRANGYLSFFYDLTPYLDKIGTNILKIRVDNSNLPHDRWYSGCGIYRHVWLNFVPDVHVPVWGTSITTPLITKNNASVTIKTAIKNNSGQAQNCILKTIVSSPEKKEVTSVKSDVTISKDSVINIVQNLDISNPELWLLEKPGLYKALSQIYINNKLYDEYETNFGIRDIRFTADEGFILNNKKVLMKGVNIHHDAGCLGSAVPDMAVYRRLKILKEMGCNAIRLSHNPHSAELISMCDTMGILLIGEAFDKWGPAFNYSINWENDLRDFLSRDRNHPSIVLWSVGNEVSEVDKPSGVEILKKMVAFVHNYEPSRPVTCALLPGRQKSGEPWEMSFFMDVVGYNYMSQYYEPDHKKYPKMIILGSETLPFYTRNNLEKDLWKKDISKKYTDGNSFFKVGDFVAGHFIWAGIDYLGEAVQPWPLKGWENGVINTCGFRKPYSFYIQSLYSDNPLVHIAVLDELNTRQTGKKGWDWPPVKSSWNWPWDSSKKLTVYTYSSCESVELLINGKSLGEKHLKDFKQKMIEWKIPYEKGELLAIGKNAGKEVARHNLVTAGVPEKIKLIPDYTHMKANNEDIIHVTACVVDKNGTLCQDNNFLVEFNLSSKAKIIGVDNGDLWSNEPYKSNKRETRDGMALCIIQAGNEKGDIVLKAFSKGIIGDSISIKTY